jgi:choline-glycine betaine transporter
MVSRAPVDAPTLFLSVALLYVSFKILVVILRRYSDAADASVTRPWARALLASLAGLSAGLLFFPAREHVAYFVVPGLAGALFQATRAHDDKLEIGLDRRDLLRILAVAAALWALRAWCL